VTDAVAAQDTVNSPAHPTEAAASQDRPGDGGPDATGSDNAGPRRGGPGGPGEGPGGCRPDGSVPGGSVPDGSVPDGNGPDGSGPDVSASDGGEPPNRPRGRPGPPRPSRLTDLGLPRTTLLGLAGRGRGTPSGRSTRTSAASWPPLPPAVPGPECA
jgi:hypothetical protein